MKNKTIKIIAIIILCIILTGCAMTGIVYARTSTSSHSSVHSSSSVKASTPKSSSSSSSSVKASTPKSSTSKTTSSSTTSKTTGKTYTTSKSTTGRTTVNHENVKVKTGTSNSNPVFYNTYRTDYSYPITNTIFSFYLLNEIFKDKDNVTEQDIAKALEEKGYTKEEVDQILDEAKQEEEENKPLFDGWKWYHWTILAIVIIAIIGIIIFICMV